MRHYALTQLDVAKVFGVSQPAVFKWLKNSVPGAETVSTIARYFNVTADDLLYGSDPKSASTKAPPTASEVEGLFRQLPPSTQHSVMQTVFKQSLRECDIELTKEDLKRGWVDAALQYLHPDTHKQYPNKVRITRLPATDASRLLTEAIVQHDPYVILLPSLPDSFVDLFPKGHPLRMLSPFCRFALIKVAVRLSFGDAVADKVLRDMGLGFFTDLLSEKDELTF